MAFEVNEGADLAQTLMVKKLELAVSRIYLKTTVLSSYLCPPSQILDTPHHKERHHQRRENDLLMPMATQEAVGTQSIRACEKLGGVLKFYSREAA